MASLLISNADAIVTVDDQDRVLTHANLLIEDGVITYLGPEAREADQVHRWAGLFCLSRPYQHPPPPLPDLYAEFPPGAKDGAVPVADGPL